MSTTTTTTTPNVKLRKYKPMKRHLRITGLPADLLHIIIKYIPEKCSCCGFYFEILSKRSGLCYRCQRPRHIPSCDTCKSKHHRAICSKYRKDNYIYKDNSRLVLNMRIKESREKRRLAALPFPESSSVRVLSL